MAKRIPRRSFGPRPGGSLVEQLFDRVGLSEEARSFRVMAAWHRLAGDRLGKHTRAERVRGGTLMVRVATAPWANELSYLRAQLLEQLRVLPGAEWITELRFTIGPLGDLPDFDDKDAARPTTPLPVLPPRPIVDGGVVAGALMQIKDPELRASLAELFARAEQFSRNVQGR